METIYCTLNAKRLTFLGAAGRKASRVVLLYLFEISKYRF